MPPDNSFLSRLRSNPGLSDVEETVLVFVGVRSPEELVSLVRAFPVLGEMGLDTAKLSSVGLQYSNQIFAAAVGQGGVASGRPPNLFHGAEPPPNVPGATGTTVPMPSAAVGNPVSSSTSFLATSGNIDLRLQDWPIRDQGRRGTCVAFALVACREHLEAENTGVPFTLLSEQYLYWAAKGHDPWPTTDATGISFAKDALAQQGTCLSPLWPYDGSLQSTGAGSNNNLTHATTSNPSPAAHADAGKRKHGAQHYAASHGQVAAAKRSEDLFNLLQAHRRPVAIAVPVFGDPLAQLQGIDSHNWNSPLAQVYGSVQNPPPSAIATAGHAVCVTGFVADASEPGGGYFIFRNSWGTTWASAGPSSGYYSPEAGYGQIPATYINNYLWEMCIL